MRYSLESNDGRQAPFYLYQCKKEGDEWVKMVTILSVSIQDRGQRVGEDGERVLN
jgi:hypothetical protein